MKLVIFYSKITFSYTKYFVHSYTVDVVFTLSYRGHYNIIAALLSTRLNTLCIGVLEHMALRPPDSYICFQFQVGIVANSIQSCHNDLNMMLRAFETQWHPEITRIVTQ